MRPEDSLRENEEQYLDSSRAREQIAHDVRHELGTIMLLASVLIAGDDIGETSRHRAQQILGETRWLTQLLAAYDDLAVRDVEMDDYVGSVRLDDVARDVVSPIQLSSLTRVVLYAEEASAHIDKLAFWRVLRNVVVNAVRAAGPDGKVEVRIAVEDGWAVTEVDDNGPGLDGNKYSPGSLGLGIVSDLMSASGGKLEICRASLGGCRVRLMLPLSRPRPGSRIRPGV